MRQNHDPVWFSQLLRLNNDTDVTFYVPVFQEEVAYVEVFLMLKFLKSCFFVRVLRPL
jgi:hypothetical protein